jgi:NAD(P)-dependent dehydrogenase (short-subunit alcohol dehydrogenase family)
MTEQDPESFGGRVAVVAGAARGIGAEIAAALARRGATVAQADILPAHEWRGDLAGPHTRHTVDIRSADSCRELVAEVLAAHGRLDHLVNSAAIMRRAPAATMADRDFGDVLDANVTGSFRICQAAYDALRGSRGSIVLLSSTNGHIAVRDKVGYASSKAAVHRGNASRLARLRA